jgi:FHA domain
MKPRLNRFRVTREDRSVDPVVLVCEGLAIGRSPGCEVHLNHPTVSRLHAGVRREGEEFYLSHLSSSNSTTLNAKLVEDRAALADGDVAQIGPFVLTFHFTPTLLDICVHYQTAVRIGDGAVAGENASAAAAQDPAAHAPPAPRPAGLAETHDETDITGAAAFDLFWGKRRREAGKIARPSPLRPHAPPRLGKTRHNWKPTRDLVRPWPPALFTWALAGVGLLSALAAAAYTNAFSPAPLADAHARRSLASSPAVAREANAGSCTSCHALAQGMESRCASCHRTEAFEPATREAHAAAGVGCVACHAEHRGRDFRAGVAPLSASFQPGVAAEQTCAGCHSDANKKEYNGRRVSTPHGGAFGYPVAAGRWVWKGLSEQSRREKPEAVRKMFETVPEAATDGERRSVQFHAIHLHRVRAVAGIKGNEAGELSCSSCHTQLGAAIDRETPRKTCAVCHNGQRDEPTGRALVAADAPNCVSCHAEHPRDRRHWNASLLAGRAP